MHLGQTDRILGRRHLNWQLKLIIVAWPSQEQLELPFRVKDVLLALVDHKQQVVAKHNLAFVLQRNRAVVKDLLALSVVLHGLVRSNSHRDALLRRKDDVVGESLRIRQEHVLLSLAFEVVEAVLVQDAQVLVMGALHKLFGVLPSDGTEVAELG